MPHQFVRVSLFPFPFGFTQILMISSSDPAACVFADMTSLNDSVFSYFHISFQFLETLVCERAFPINLCVLVCFRFHLGSHKYQ